MPRTDVRRIALPTAVVLSLVVAFEALRATGVLAQEVFPSTASVLSGTVALLGSADTWSSIGVTLVSWAVGLLLGVAVGVPAGMLTGSNRLVDRLTRLSINLLRPIPVVALMPLFILILGLGIPMGIALVAISTIWPILFQAVLGVRSVDGTARSMIRVSGFGRVRRFTKLTLPSALPSIATGLRLASILGLIIAISASLVGGGPGLGSDIASASQNGNMRTMWALILICGTIGLLVTTVFTSIENRVMRWHPSRRSVGA